MTNQNSLDEAYIKLIKDQRVHSEDLKESFSIIAKHCAEALSVCRVGIWLLSEDQNTLECLSLYILEEQEFQSGAVLNTKAFPEYLNALLNARVIDANNAPKDKRTSELYSSYLKPEDIKSMLDATLRYEGNVQGVICSEMVENQRDWTTKECIFIASVADFISQKLLINQLKRSEERYKALFENTNDGICVFDGHKFVDTNPAWNRMFRGEVDDFIGLSPKDFSPEHQKDGQLSELKAYKYISACLKGEPQNFDWTHKRVDRTEFDADVTLNQVSISGKDTLFALVRDVTLKKEAERKAQLAQDNLEYRAAHDSLTGLLNREQLHIHIDTLITRATVGPSKPNGKPNKIALLLFDLNRFKEINDTLGHATGDKVLRKLSALLSQRLKSINSELFRLGGDEFVAVFDERNCKVSFENLDSELNQYLKTGIDVNDISVEMSASMGIALFPDNGKDSHELLRCADVAMYHSKSNNESSPWYDVQNDDNNKRRLAMMVELGHAIRNDQLVLHYQPRIQIKTGKVTGCEALVRWQHPKLGLIPPGDFLPLAEMSDLIHPLSAWVLNNAFSQIQNLQKVGHEVPIAINISARNLADSQMVDTIEMLFKTKNISPNLLEIEITESALFNHPKRALQNLKRLDDLGVSIAIDDFGTGYSSLSRLNDMPSDTIKIDRSFVKDMLTSSSDALIVSTTIGLAHNFSHKVVAEGVEDQQTLESLAALNCDQAQGFFIAKPMPAADLKQWLKKISKNTSS